MRYRIFVIGDFGEMTLDTAWTYVEFYQPMKELYSYQSFWSSSYKKCQFGAALSLIYSTFGSFLSRNINTGIRNEIWVYKKKYQSRI